MNNCGKDLRFQVKLAGTFVSLDGETSVSGTINREAADATAKSSMPWRDILQSCGLASATAKCSGFPVSNLSASVWAALQTAARMGDMVECAVVHIDPVTAVSTVYIRFFGLVTSFDRGGDKNAAETYTITVESSGFVNDSYLFLKVATPVFSPTGGSITTSDIITIACATSGAAIYYTIDGSTPVPTAILLADPSKILGVYDFGVGAYSTANIVTIAPAGSYSGIFSGLSTAVSFTPSYSGYGQKMGVNNFGVSAATGITSSSTSITVALFLKATNNAVDVLIGTGPTNDTAFPMLIRLSNSGGTMNVPGAGSVTVPAITFDGTWHHYAVTVNGTAYKMYKDGTVVLSGTLSGNTGFRIDYIKSYGVMGGVYASWDNVFFSKEALSSAAVASLAAGNMPNASGVLAGLSAGTYLYTAPFTLPVQSGIDPSKWLGAYNFPTSPSPNIVTSSPAGSLYTGAGGTIVAGDLVLSAVGQQGVSTWSGTSVTGVSFSCFAKYAALSTMLVRIQLGSSSFPNIYLNSGTFYDCDGNIVIGYVSPAVLDGAQHHYAWAWDFASGKMVVYRDGSVFQTLFTAVFGTRVVDRAFLESVSGAVSTVYISKLTVYNGALSSAAVASLAAGNMPNASGVLAGVPLLGVTTIKAIGVKANYFDSDIATANFNVSQFVYSVAWGDSGLKLSNQGAYLNSLIRSTLPLPVGRKVYFEVAAVYAPDNQNRVQIGVTLSTKPVHPSTLGQPLGLGSDEYVTQLPDPDDGGMYVYNRSPNVLSGTAIPVIGARIGILWDGVNGEFSIKALNTGGASQSVFSVKTGMNGSTWYLCFGGSSAGLGGNIQAEMFVTPASLSYSVPSGYEAGWSD